MSGYCYCGRPLPCAGADHDAMAVYRAERDEFVTSKLCSHDQSSGAHRAALPDLSRQSRGSILYRTIVADPPWHYGRFLSNKGRPGPAERAAGVDRKVELIVQKLPYPSMTVAEIMDLPVSDLADPAGANLFLWTTNRYLHDAFHVAAAWGFEYRQAIVWSKPRGSRPPFRATISPNCAEYLLLCRSNGGAPFGDLWETNVVEVPRPGGHSQKPEAFLDLVEQVSPSPYLELFARRQRLGWDTWGNEALEHVEMPA